MINDCLNFDIYSNRIGFFFNDKEKIGTFLGLFLTILYILFSILIFIIYILYTIKRKNFNVVYESTALPKDSPRIDVNASLIYFALSLKDPNSSSRFIDETIFHPKILFLDKKKDKKSEDFNTSEIKELEYEVCEKEKFGEDYQKYITDEELNNSYCLKDFDLPLTGGNENEKMSYLRIKIYPCVNNTHNNNCQPQETIDEYLNGGYLSILTKDIKLNPNNYSFPIISTFQSIYATIDNDYIIYYGITEIETDIGLFSENIKKERYVQFRKIVQSFYIKEESEYEQDKALCSIDIRLDDHIFIQKRIYTKITDILPVIGGYMQLLNTIFSLLSLFTSRLIPHLKILNGIFNFNIKEKKMQLKINTIKEFNSLLLQKEFSFPSNKQLCDSNSKPPAANRYYRNSLKITDNKINISNLSKNSLMGFDNNDNNSSVTKVLNQRKHQSLIVIKEKGNERSSMNNNISNDAKDSILEEKKNNFMDKKRNNDNTNGNKNYIYRVGSFYPKLISSQKKQNNSNNELLKVYNDKLQFNIFDYYCIRGFSRKKNDIELFKLGLSLYTKRMDIINVFTLLLLTEKNCLQTEELY